MRLFVRHRSDYRFSEPQARLVQLLRLRPANNGGQSILGWRIDVDCDARLKQARDGYGNQTTMLYIDGPIERITLDVSGEVLTEDQAGMLFGTAEPLPPVYFRQSTALTRADAAILDFAAATEGGGSALDRAHRLCDGLHERLGQLEARRGIDHSAAASFAAGEADPQGTAHVLVAAARARGFAARYVAGHIYRPEAVDSHSAHGWAEIFIDDYGWIGFDPHEGSCPTDHYVRVATGLDHREAGPVSGWRVGAGDEALEVDVHVGPEPARQD